MEETVQVIADIPAVPGVVILTDCNTVVVSKHLTEAEREDALSEALATWRRSFLRSAV